LRFARDLSQPASLKLEKSNALTPVGLTVPVSRF